MQVRGAGWVCAVFSLWVERTVGGGLGLGWDGLFVHVEAGVQVWGGRLGVRCGLSRGREDCGRGVGMGLGVPVCARRGYGCK